MKKRMLMVLMALCMVSSQKVLAADLASAEAYIHEEDAEEEGGMSEFGIGREEEPRLFETEYIVIVSSVSFRSGPGYGYSVDGILYQGDYVMVKSINEGWAKFNYAGTYKYVPASALQKN